MSTSQIVVDRFQNVEEPFVSVPHNGTASLRIRFL